MPILPAVSLPVTRHVERITCSIPTLALIAGSDVGFFASTERKSISIGRVLLVFYGDSRRLVRFVFGMEERISFLAIAGFEALSFGPDRVDESVRPNVEAVAALRHRQLIPRGWVSRSRQAASLRRKRRCCTNTHRQFWDPCNSSLRRAAAGLDRPSSAQESSEQNSRCRNRSCPLSVVGLAWRETRINRRC